MAANSILAKMQVLISAQTAEFNQALQRSQTQLNSFVGGIQKMAGQVGLAFGAFQAFSVVKDAVNSIREFEKELSTVRAITGATGDEFNALKKSALELGASTRYTSTQVAGLQVEYGRLGFSTKEILAATRATLNLATATGSDLAKAADVAGSTVRGFQLSADETVRVVDVMAKSFNSSALSMDNFSESMKYVAPIANAAGATVEETTALLGTLADAGIRGSQAGTSLRKIFAEISKDGRPLAERLEELGKKGLTIKDAFDEVGRTAQTALLVLAKNTDKTRELTTELNYAAGAGKEMARVMEDNLTGDLIRLSSAYDGFVQSLGEGTGVLRDLTQGLTKLVSALTSGEGALGGFISSWANWVTIVPKTLIGALGGLADLATGAGKANKEMRDLEAKNATIAAHVEAAWKSGISYLDVYIESLDGVEHEYEIIRAILKKFADEQSKVTNEVLAPQVGIIQGIQDQLKKFEEDKKNAFSEAEITRFNVKIDELKEKLEALNAARPLSGFGLEQLANAQSGKETKFQDPSKIGRLSSDSFNKNIADVAGINADAAEAANQRIINSEDLLIKKLQETKDVRQSIANAQNVIHEQTMAEYEQSISKALEYGDAIGGAIGSVISGQESAMQALKKLSGQIISIFLKQALAGIIKSATQTPGPPPVVLAAAAAGVAAITGLFAGLGASGGGGGGSRGVAVARTAASTGGSLSGSGQEILVGGEVVIHGDDLRYIINRNNQKSERRRG